MMKNIEGGIYLVVDPSIGEQVLLQKVEEALKGGVDIIQIWNNWTKSSNKLKLVDRICELAHRSDVPVLINEEWELINDTLLDGVHFDSIPNDIMHVRQQVERPFICGITCGNDLSIVRWAEANKLDYISFCSMFPSNSAGACEIVSIENVKKAKALTSMPVFLAGGISLDNIHDLKETNTNGIAVISAILQADNVAEKTKQFKQKLMTLNQ